MTSEYRHVPVMLEEVVRSLAPAPGEVVCDCTLGGAGHSVALARKVAPDGLSIGIDQDDMALEAAAARFAREAPEARTCLLKGNFADLDDLLIEAEVPGVDCFLFDLGVSSPQLDIPQRGFSYHEDAPLDMRMDPGNNTLTASEVVNTYNEADLARILRTYGDERHASRIARAIVRERKVAPLESCAQLAEVVRDAIPARDRRHGRHPARKAFQAIRIEVNGELDALERGLEAAIRWANPGGRICVISYHSLEDRIVKRMFGEMSKGCVCPPEFPVCVCGHVPIVTVETKRALQASEDEVRENPRARSALMRVARRLDTSGA
ncbi:MAG: 16S rRNA (cytosine(1402)-N(4))-methyltransferase RsmH [Atopobiaceae bacterium]|nr:16S rRNA (cytosine(1402)-N(4))-methyltransferase RsmH [Atopobiaceae bacterium]